MFTNETLAGKTVAFKYEGADRMVEVEKVNKAGNGSTMVLGKDKDKNDAYRQFNVNKMTDVVIIVS